MSSIIAIVAMLFDVGHALIAHDTFRLVLLLRLNLAFTAALSLRVVCTNL